MIWVETLQANVECMRRVAEKKSRLVCFLSLEMNASKLHAHMDTRNSQAQHNTTQRSSAQLKRENVNWMQFYALH